jgi:hypothetical protein
VSEIRYESNEKQEESNNAIDGACAYLVPFELLLLLLHYALCGGELFPLGLRLGLGNLYTRQRECEAIASMVVHHRLRHWPRLGGTTSNGKGNRGGGRRKGRTYVLLARQKGGGTRQLREHVALLCAVGGEAHESVEQELHRIAARLVQVRLDALLAVQKKKIEF